MAIGLSNGETYATEFDYMIGNPMGTGKQEYDQQQADEKRQYEQMFDRIKRMDFMPTEGIERMEPMQPMNRFPNPGDTPPPTIKPTPGEMDMDEGETGISEPGIRRIAQADTGTMSDAEVAPRTRFTVRPRSTTQDENKRTSEAPLPQEQPSNEYNPSTSVLDQVIDKGSTIVKGIANHLLELAKLPGNVYSGKIDPSSPEGVDKAIDLAFNLVTGGASTVPLRTPGLGIFGGKIGASRDAEVNARLQKADRDTLKDSVDYDKVYNETGVFYGPEGSPRFEISDKDSRLNLKAFQKIAREDELVPDPKAPAGWGVVESGEPHYVVPPLVRYQGDLVEPTVGDLLIHSDLYKHYPELRDIPVTDLTNYNLTHGTNYSGGYFHTENSIGLIPGTESQIRSVLMHELQHAVQRIEGHARGANPEIFKPNTESYRILRESTKQIDGSMTNLYNDVVQPRVLPKLKEYFNSLDKAQHATRPYIDELLAKSYANKSTIDNIMLDQILGNKLDSNAKAVLEILKKVAPKYYTKAENLAKAKHRFKLIDDKAFQDYKKTYGEVESRMTQQRLEMTPAERQGMPAWAEPEFTTSYPEGTIDPKYIRINE